MAAVARQARGGAGDAAHVGPPLRDRAARPHHRAAPPVRPRRHGAARTDAAGAAARRAPAEAARFALRHGAAGATTDVVAARDGGTSLLREFGTRSASVLGLGRAAMAMDAVATQQLIADSIAPHGVVAVLERGRAAGAGRARQPVGSTPAQCVEVEHLVNECALAAISARRPLVTTPRNPRPVLLACMPEERHNLPLTYCAPSSAGGGIGVQLLGAALPADALAAAVRRTGPAAVAVWAQLPRLRRAGRVRPGAADAAAGAAVRGGPGWFPTELPRPGGPARGPRRRGAPDRVAGHGRAADSLPRSAGELAAPPSATRPTCRSSARRPRAPRERWLAAVVLGAQGRYARGRRPCCDDWSRTRTRPRRARRRHARLPPPPARGHAAARALDAPGSPASPAGRIGRTRPAPDVLLGLAADADRGRPARRGPPAAGPRRPRTRLAGTVRHGWVSAEIELERRSSRRGRRRTPSGLCGAGGESGATRHRIKSEIVLGAALGRVGDRPWPEELVSRARGRRVRIWACCPWSGRRR